MSVRSAIYKGAPPGGIVSRQIPVSIPVSALAAVAPQTTTMDAFTMNGFYETLPNGNRLVTVTSGVIAANANWAAQAPTLVGTFGAPPVPGTTDNLRPALVGEVSAAATFNDATSTKPGFVTLDSDGAFTFSGSTAMAASAGGLKGFTITYIANPYSGPAPTPS